MFARLTPLYCGSSFSSWIGALVGEPRLPIVGGEFGPESGVLLLQSEDEIFYVGGEREKEAINPTEKIAWR